MLSLNQGGSYARAPPRGDLTSFIQALPTAEIKCCGAHSDWTIGIDLAKAVFPMHGVDAADTPVLKKQFRRRQGIEQLDRGLRGSIAQRQEVH